jgi:hypothetical protein
LQACRQLREEAAICRELAREIRDPPSIAMFLARAAQLEARANALEASGQPGRPEVPAKGAEPTVLRAELPALSRR